MPTDKVIIIFILSCLVICLTKADERRITAKRSGLCDRPQDRFSTVTEIDKYIECLKIKSNRYGKRAYSSPMIQKLVPDQFSDYYRPSEDNWQEIYELLKYRNTDN